MLEAKVKNIVGYIVDKEPEELDFRDNLKDIGYEDSELLIQQLLFEFDSYFLSERELDRAVTVGDVYQVVSKKVK
jgi:hypothetical protein